LIDIASAAESSVVALARTGDERAYTELVRRRQLSIRGLLSRLCRDSALADDLAQDTFLQAWRQLHTLKSDGAFGGWVRQIASNVWLQHVRYRRESAQQLDSSPEASMEHSTSEAIDLDRALARLMPIERLCIVLSYNEGMSHGQIAGMLGLPLGTVKTHIGRATEYLRSLLSAYQRTRNEK
jgi:RNA polymerase sigma-70 factor, ECF subfamily